MQVTSPVVPPLIIKGMTPLSPVFENLLNKKVNKIALNIFERLIDALCSFFYKTYTDRQNFKLTARYFQDGALLIDCTEEQRVTIKQPEEFFDPVTQQPLRGHDEIFIDGCRVDFRLNAFSRFVFGRDYGTVYMVATTVPQFPELVIVCERETPDNVKAWCVDTRRPTEEISVGWGQGVTGTQKVFIAQQIGNLPQPPSFYKLPPPP